MRRALPLLVSVLLSSSGCVSYWMVKSEDRSPTTKTGYAMAIGSDVALGTALWVELARGDDGLGFNAKSAAYAAATALLVDSFIAGVIYVFAHDDRPTAH